MQQTLGILATLVIVAYNGVQQSASEAAMKATLAQWKKKSEIHKVENGIVCPDNYAFVYGNDSLGTADFCVMKYEAKNVEGVATSQASGTLWTSISQTSAIATASAACDGCHLITEAEWMTIAADVLSVDYNWSGHATGQVGNGSIFSGHSDGAPNNPLAASADDNDGYFGTLNTGSDGANQRRTLYLSSGDVIWDFAGNLWEWTSDTLSVTPGASGSSWGEYTDITDWSGLPTASRPSALAGIPGLDDVASWNSSQGIGQTVTGWGVTQGADPGVRAHHRGGRWSNGPGAGVLTLALDTAPSTGYTFTGFRVTR